MKNNKGTSGGAESLYINDDMNFYSLGNGEKNNKDRLKFLERDHDVDDGTYQLHVRQLESMVTLPVVATAHLYSGRNNKYAFFPSTALA